MRAALLVLLGLLALVAGPVYANWCATPGRDGTATISGVVNTYFPTTAIVGAGTTTFAVGAATGDVRGIAAGDLLLVVQMQDGAFDRTNDDGYGDNVGGGFASGYTAIQLAGNFEFVRAGNNVPSTGGNLTVIGAAGGGLVGAYRHTALSDTNARESWQVIRVPQYIDATVSGTVTAAPWNGSTGGVVAIDVARNLTFAGGAISANGAGFRGGGGRTLTGGSGTNTTYRSLATVNNNGAKGEGIVGTPRYVNNNGGLQNLGVEGYRDGSNARGAPGNAGGGGTDGNPANNQQNSGGGGGGNGGAGGRGGHAWCSTAPAGCPQTGGHPGAAVTEIGVSRVVMGGGGGAGTTNNGTGTPGSGFASSGAAGGGLVFVRAGEVAGSGTLSANGASANSTVTTDGAGGGGAGGAILFSTLRTAPGASISASANGGNGGSNSGGGSAYGPGGGGGGGFIASSIVISTSTSGGLAGTTGNGGAFGAQYGAGAGSGGDGISITGASVPGLSSGGECTPTVTKSFTTSPIAVGATSRMSITVRNNNPTTALTAVAFTDTYPAGLVNTSTPAAATSCGSGTLSAAANGSSLALAGGTITVANVTCTYSVNTTVTSTGDKTNTLASGAVAGSYGSYGVTSLGDVSAVLLVSAPLTIVKATQVQSDPYNGTTNPKGIPGGYLTYTVTVANPGSGTVDNNTIIVLDATPANLQLFVSDVASGAGPLLFQQGSPSSALTYSYVALSSDTDDIEFSNNGGTSWTYEPVPNASGVDPNVTHFRVRPKGVMAANSSFTLQFRYRIN